MCISVRKKSTKEKNNNRVLLDTKKKKKEFIVRLWLELKQLTVFVARGIKGQSFSLFTSTIFSQLSLPRMLAALFHLYCLVSAWLAKNTGSFVSCSLCPLLSLPKMTLCDQQAIKIQVLMNSSQVFHFFCRGFDMFARYFHILSRGFGGNVWPFIACLHFKNFFLLKWRLAHAQ